MADQEKVTAVEGFGLYYPAIQGPGGIVERDGDVWRWKIESPPQGCATKERAMQEMQAALEGASVIDGLDAHGRRVERRSK